MKHEGSNDDRRTRWLATIQARLHTMDEFMKTGAPADFPLPKTLAQFRQMDIPELAIESIGSPGTLNKSQNSDISEKIDEIRDRLKKARAHVPGQTPRPPSLSEVNRRLRRVKRQQGLTIARLTSAIHQQADELRRAKKDFGDCQKRLAKVTAELNRYKRAGREPGLRIVTPDDE